MQSRRAWDASFRASIRLSLFISISFFYSVTEGSVDAISHMLGRFVLVVRLSVCFLSPGPYGFDLFFHSFCFPPPFQGPFITVLLECSLAAWYLRQTQTNSNQFYIRLNPEVSPYKHSLTGRPRLDYEYRIPFIIVVYHTFVALYLSNLKTTSSRLSFSPTTYLSFPQILPLPAISKTSSGFRVTSEVGVRMLSKSFRSKGHMKADR